AFTAPAEVPEMPSISRRPSSSSWSSTPQVKAPCAPPPCRARLIGFAGCLLARPSGSGRRRGAWRLERESQEICEQNKKHSRSRANEEQRAGYGRRIAALQHILWRCSKNEIPSKRVSCGHVESQTFA